MRLSAGQMLRGLRALESAGLVRFVKEGRGRCPVVEIVAQLRPQCGQT
jgi:predicted transcriptional regulator